MQVKKERIMIMQNFANPVILQIVNILLLVSWIVLSLISLIRIKNITLSSTSKAIWVLIVICVPILGAIALFIVNPSDSTEYEQ
jgi:hypothetical protein